MVTAGQVRVLLVWPLLGAMTGAFVIAVLGFGGFFQLTPLDFQSGLVIVVFLLLTPSVIYVLERAVDVAGRLAVLCRRRIGEPEPSHRQNAGMREAEKPPRRGGFFAVSGVIARISLPDVKKNIAICFTNGII